MEVQDLIGGMDFVIRNFEANFEVLYHQIPPFDNNVLKVFVIFVSEVFSCMFLICVGCDCCLPLCMHSSGRWMKSKNLVIGVTLLWGGVAMNKIFDALCSLVAMVHILIQNFMLECSSLGLALAGVIKLLMLPSYYAAGLILVACCPGGTASNIVTYIARGNVALSVLMTAASTVSAVVMTPMLTAKLAGQFVAVDAAGLLISTLQVVLLPVLIGALLNQYCQNVVKVVSPLMPPISVATVAILCGNAIAQNASAILMSGQQVVLSVCLLRASGFFFGYILSRALGLDVSSSCTISIEVGMQVKFRARSCACRSAFREPLTAVPCAVSSVCHSIFGSLLAGIWRYNTTTASKQD
ncbi:hypothetical protein Scep_011888 [Stephania cephalantha]|uniref:Uncharacterized protein n=1 Tax=Stephania cephalantha TaxID=152367 RepID=A0AAP0JG55_9MAGN